VKIYLHLLGEEDTIIEVGNMAALEKTTLEQVGQIKLRKLELNNSHQPSVKLKSVIDHFFLDTFRLLVNKYALLMDHLVSLSYISLCFS